MQLSLLSGFSAAKYFSLTHIELKVNKTSTKRFHAEPRNTSSPQIRYQSPGTSVWSIWATLAAKKKKKHFSLVFIKFLLPIRNKYTRSYKKRENIFQFIYTLNYTTAIFSQVYQVFGSVFSRAHSER